MCENNIIKKILVVCTTDSMIWNFLIPHIKKWESQGFRVDCACSETGFYFSELESKYSLNMIKIPFQRSPYKLSNITSLIQLHRLIKREQYSLIVTQEPVGGAIGRLGSLFTNSKVIYTAHGFHFYKGCPIINWLIYYPIERILAHFTDVLITSNEEDYQRSLSFKADLKIMIKGVGIDLSKFSNDFTIKPQIKKKLMLLDNSKIVLTVGELINRKNISICIKAFSEIKTPNSYLVICGDGPQKKELVELARELKIQEKVIFLGFRKDLNEIYKIADVFFFPSLQEGLSVALLGAMASGLPIVCSNIRGNIDLVKNNVGGYLCYPNDYMEFAHYLDIVLQKNDSEMGKFNANIAKDYEMNKAVDYMFEIIKNTIKEI